MKVYEIDFAEIRTALLLGPLHSSPADHSSNTIAFKLCANYNRLSLGLHFVGFKLNNLRGKRYITRNSTAKTEPIIGTFQRDT